MEDLKDEGSEELGFQLIGHSVSVCVGDRGTDGDETDVSDETDGVRGETDRHGE